MNFKSKYLGILAACSIFLAAGDSNAAVSKFSQIASGGALNSNTDTMLAVRNGNTDVLVTLSAGGAANSIQTNTGSGGFAGDSNFTYDGTNVAVLSGTVYVGGLVYGDGFLLNAPDDGVSQIGYVSDSGTGIGFSGGGVISFYSFGIPQMYVNNGFIQIPGLANSSGPQGYITTDISGDLELGTLGPAAFYPTSSPSQYNLAVVNNSTSVAGNFPVFGDTTGSIQDEGYGPASFSTPGSNISQFNNDENYVNQVINSLTSGNVVITAGSDTIVEDSGQLISQFYVYGGGAGSIPPSSLLVTDGAGNSTVMGEANPSTGDVLISGVFRCMVLGDAGGSYSIDPNARIIVSVPGSIMIDYTGTQNGMANLSFDSSDNSYFLGNVDAVSYSVGGTAGFTGTGVYTTFTISNGLITNAM